MGGVLSVPKLAMALRSASRAAAAPPVVQGSLMASHIAWQVTWHYLNEKPVPNNPTVSNIKEHIAKPAREGVEEARRKEEDARRQAEEVR